MQQKLIKGMKKELAIDQLHARKIQTFSSGNISLSLNSIIYVYIV